MHRRQVYRQWCELFRSKPPRAPTSPAHPLKSKLEIPRGRPLPKGSPKRGNAFGGARCSVDFLSAPSRDETTGEDFSGRCRFAMADCQLHKPCCERLCALLPWLLLQCAISLRLQKSGEVESGWSLVCVTWLVRKGGLEPPRFYPPDPKSGASANSATFAFLVGTSVEHAGSLSDSKKKVIRCARHKLRHRSPAAIPSLPAIDPPCNAVRRLLFALEGAETVLAHQGVALGFFQIGLHHFANQLFETDGRFPSESISGVGRVAQ